MTLIIGHRAILLLSSALLFLSISVRAEQTTFSSGSQDRGSSSTLWTSGRNLVKPPDFPVIGKWMLGSDGTAAHWLGELYRGKSLREPINIIIVDEVARDADEASARILDASRAAGYPVRLGHSTGYQGYIGGQLYTQLPRGRDDAFSNEPSSAITMAEFSGLTSLAVLTFSSRPSAVKKSIHFARPRIDTPPSTARGTISRKSSIKQHRTK
jgi:hypothetical protein